MQARQDFPPGLISGVKTESGSVGEPQLFFAPTDQDRDLHSNQAGSSVLEIFTIHFSYSDAISFVNYSTASVRAFWSSFPPHVTALAFAGAA
ncbi:hypothetical protein B0O99DRAFT_69280 [Bisporella sp. PMI_857]|nr:hypothetical protein B0O99DRAFT_69280 [Bisporella sp. PMI_857]